MKPDPDVDLSDDVIVKEDDMHIYKIEAQGDTVYVEAETEAIAVLRLAERLGPVPRSLLTITLVEALPEGEDLL